jgi:hypothetical protein
MIHNDAKINQGSSSADSGLAWIRGPTAPVIGV